MKFVLYSIVNKDKSTEIFPPSLLKSTYICVRTGKANAKKVQQKVPH